MTDFAIEVRGLTMRFGKRPALAELDLTVPRCTTLGFLGPNDAGKTIAGCGFDGQSAGGEVATAADDYLRALAEDYTSMACAQLAEASKAELDRSRDDELREVARRIGSDALSAAADAGVEVEVSGNRSVADVRSLAGARLTFAKAGTDWRITSGQALGERS